MQRSRELASRGAIDSRVKARQWKLGEIGSRAARISGSSLAAYWAVVEAGALEQLPMGSTKPAASKVSSTIEKLRG